MTNVCLLGDGRFSPTEETGSENEHQVLALGGLSGRQEECSYFTANTQEQFSNKFLRKGNPPIGASGFRSATEFPDQPGGCETTIPGTFGDQAEGGPPGGIRFNKRLESANFAPAVEFPQTDRRHSQFAGDSLKKITRWIPPARLDFAEK
jgi:hypothetical protein